MILCHKTYLKKEHFDPNPDTNKHCNFTMVFVDSTKTLFPKHGLFLRIDLLNNHIARPEFQPEKPSIELATNKTREDQATYREAAHRLPRCSKNTTISV